MKYIFSFIAFLSFTFFSFSQISVAQKDLKKIDDADYERFKKTETIFLLSNLYDKTVYEDMLKDTWTVTPYKIVNINDFNLKDYLTDHYSFVHISSSMRGNMFTKGGVFKDPKKPSSAPKLLYTFVDIIMFNNEKKSKELQKVTSEKELNVYNLMEDYQIPVARLYLSPNENYITRFIADKKPHPEEPESLYKDDLFYNLKPGFLKNYFQKINEVLKAGGYYSIFTKKAENEVKKLANTTLYIPNYIKLEANPWSRDKEEDSKKLFGNYNYKHEFIDDNELDKKIQNEEEFYYLRYVRMNTDKYIQIINSKTGAIIYSDYIPSLMSLKIDEDHLKKINKAIEKELKV